MAEPAYDFKSPGGLHHDLIGPKITAAATVAPSKLVHHVTGTTEISTITVPWEGFTGPLYLVADSVFTWTTSGNIGASNPTTVVASQAYGFLYDRKAAKWYPLAF